jgi:hypothetical protein
VKKGSRSFPFFISGAGEESRTLDLNLGKVALYQLSYSRRFRTRFCIAATAAEAELYPSFLVISGRRV